METSKIFQLFFSFAFQNKDIEIVRTKQKSYGERLGEAYIQTKKGRQKMRGTGIGKERLGENEKERVDFSPIFKKCSEKVNTNTRRLKNKREEEDLDREKDRKRKRQRQAERI